MLTRPSTASAATEPFLDGSGAGTRGGGSMVVSRTGSTSCRGMAFSSTCAGYMHPDGTSPHRLHHAWLWCVMGMIYQAKEKMGGEEQSHVL